MAWRTLTFPSGVFLAPSRSSSSSPCQSTSLATSFILAPSACLPVFGSSSVASTCPETRALVLAVGSTRILKVTFSNFWLSLFQ